MTTVNLTVGSELAPLQVEPITRKTLALFAGASGDHQPSHIDIDAAKAKGRDDVIAHGMLTMAYMSRLLTDNLPQSAVRTFSARFLSFTPVHARPTFRAKVMALEGALATFELSATLDDGTVVAKGEAQVAIA
ncbi:MaoC/PaaZ C-terminal domain-containing protein [Novosphingobium album (ex Liu et al. 2023)]|uniref:MaoC/PaaZ C-terminal domain-containing protein n=1 Tax=Novosphingobium album (ex Liu et al. 2023) TaxID=3031130 RepID=A0ABT5WQU2_9SPHN|nr:MaoC/PaaZ C-terminal domain-containing protein [Novosphingobium album (ex Liu et al. 2023)]MDE8652420.1 MaoC/PaaZ C-terminal domain-containing protein [Novosphingobium album (ex Liu et al. 2023)]